MDIVVRGGVVDTVFLHDYRYILSWRLPSIVRWSAGRYLTRYPYLIIIGLNSTSNISLDIINRIWVLIRVIAISGRSSSGYEKGIFEVSFKYYKYSLRQFRRSSINSSRRSLYTDDSDTLVFS